MKCICGNEQKEDFPELESSTYSIPVMNSFIINRGWFSEEKKHQQVKLHVCPKCMTVKAIVISKEL